MASYLIASAPPTPRKKVLHAFLFTALWLLGFSAFERLATGQWDHPWALGIAGLVFFAGSLLWETETPAYELVIDDYGIRMFVNGKVLRTVSRGQVRYVRESRSLWGKCLVVSEHSSLFKRRVRGIIVLKSLPRPDEYEQIKALALSWLESARKE